MSQKDRNTPARFIKNPKGEKANSKPEVKNKSQSRQFLEPDEFRVLALGLFFIALTFATATEGYYLVKHHWPGGLSDWNQWDAPHYLDLARYGYTNTGEQGLFIVFFPLYPLATWLVSQGLRDVLLSGLVVSNLAFLAAALFLHKLARLEGLDENKSLLTIAFFSLFPTAVFLHAPYTESLFLAFAVGSFYFARKSQWPLAGALGALASATRVTGIVLLPALALEYLSQKKYDTKKVQRKAFWLLLIPLGLLGYLALNQTVYHDALAFAKIQQTHWFETPAWPWEGFLSSWNSTAWRTGLDVWTIGYAQVVFALIGLAASLWAFRLRPSYGAYALLTWLAYSSISFWISQPRYTLALFPMFLMLGKIKNENLQKILMAAAVILFAVACTAYVTGTFIS